MSRYDRILDRYESVFQRLADGPYYEPTDYAWIDEPTAKCSSDACQNWFAIERKTCPLCCTVRGSRNARKT